MSRVLCDGCITMNIGEGCKTTPELGVYKCPCIECLLKVVCDVPCEEWFTYFIIQTRNENQQREKIKEVENDHMRYR